MSDLFTLAGEYSRLFDHWDFPNLTTLDGKPLTLVSHDEANIVSVVRRLDLGLVTRS